MKKKATSGNVLSHAFFMLCLSLPVIGAAQQIDDTALASLPHDSAVRSDVGTIAFQHQQLLDATVAHNNTASISCRDYKNLTGHCSSHRYAPIELHFRDESNVEHLVQIHRIFDPSGKVIQSDLDFKMTCDNNCQQNKAEAFSRMMWGFRNAILSKGGLYQYRPCDSTREVCCGKNGCSQILSEPTNGMEALEAAIPESSVTEFAGRARPPRPNPGSGGTVIDALDALNLGLDMLDTASRASSNEQQAMQNVNQLQFHPVAVVEVGLNGIVTGFAILTSDNKYENVGGSITEVSEAETIYDLHPHQRNADILLGYIIRTNYTRGRQCIQQKMNCDGSFCNIQMRCFKPR